MKKIHLLLIYIYTILVCASCNENDEIIKEQSGEKYSRSQEIQNILGETENLSFYISPKLENIPLTKEDTERIKKLALKVDDTNQNIQTSITRQMTRNSSAGYHEELLRIDNLQLIVALEWVAEFDLFTDYNANAQKIKYADIHMNLKDAPYGYWYQITLKGWNFEFPEIAYRGQGELCKYMDNEEHLEMIGFTFFIEPRYNGYGVNFRYTLD